MLKIKLFKWFAGLVLVFGALSALLGIWMIGQRVVDEAQTRVRYDLSSAWAVYDSQLNSASTIVRLTAARSVLHDACAEQKWNDPAGQAILRGLLAKVCLDFNLDFMTLVAPDGKVVARAMPPYHVGEYRNADVLVAKALAGEAASGTVLLAKEELVQEADGLVDRAFVDLRETPHARQTPRTVEDRGMVMMAAAPIVVNGKTLGALYGGVLLNRNQGFVDRVQSIVFGNEKYHGNPTGSVTMFLADTRVATTVRLANGNRAIGTRVSTEVADRVLDNAGSWLDRAFVVNDYYLTAYDPIRDPRGQVVGMLYVGTLEQPFTDLRNGMILRYSGLVLVFLIGALLAAMLVAGRIAKPMHRLAMAADAMQRGESVTCVSADNSCRETAGLIRSFNEMAAALSDRETKLKDTNDQLAGANQSLKALNQHYMETLQFVSHELNSPLSAISNYTYTLRQGLLGELTGKQEKALDVVGANLKRLMEMVRHYLNLARIESGEVRPVPSRVMLREQVLMPMLSSLEADLRARNLHVEDDVDPRIALHCDPNMAREVFENLLSNAMKYGREGGRVWISCQPNGHWAHCKVRNEGEGIPADKQGELFQKFSRLELDGRKTARGTGLGLFICKKIVEAHGGSISVESQVGHWTEFQCTFPLDGSQGAAAGQQQDGQPAQVEQN